MSSPLYFQSMTQRYKPSQTLQFCNSRDLFSPQVLTTALLGNVSNSAVSILCPQVHILMKTSPLLYPNCLLLLAISLMIEWLLLSFLWRHEPSSFILLKASLNPSLALFQTILSLLCLSLCPGLASTSNNIKTSPGLAVTTVVLESMSYMTQVHSQTVFQTTKTQRCLRLPLLSLSSATSTQPVTRFLAKHAH